MKTVAIEIPKDLSTYIESLAYETNSRKDIIAFMIDRGMINSEGFQSYHNEYQEYYMKYELAKKEMADKYVSPEHPGCTWTLDFQTGIVTVEVLE